MDRHETGRKKLAGVFGGRATTAPGSLVQFHRSCAVAWASGTIEVNAVPPGPGRPTGNCGRKGRRGSSENLAGTVVFLPGTASDYVTGAPTNVDSGFSIRD